MSLRFTATEHALRDAIKREMRGNLNINSTWQLLFHCGADDKAIEDALKQTFDGECPDASLTGPALIAATRKVMLIPQPSGLVVKPMTKKR